MSDNLACLLQYFPSGTTEGELTILSEVFIYTDEFARIISPPQGNPLLLVGRKGSGKSALLAFTREVLEQQEVPAIMLTPSDINSGALSDSASTGEMKRVYADALLGAIAGKLAEKDTGWFSGDGAAIYNAAVAGGERAPDLFGKIVNAVTALAKPLKLDADEALKRLSQATRREVQGAVGRVIKKKNFYLFIDDTDQVASPEKSGHLNRIWALILAVREISARIPELRAVITLRSEIWHRLRSEETSARDQTDHFRSLLVEMPTSKQHVRKILERRLALAAKLAGAGADIFGPFFEGSGARPRSSPAFRSWDDLVVVRSRDRPRDAIQLVNAMANEAIRRRKPRIDESVFQSEMPKFSALMAEQFGKEVVYECPEAAEILRTFSSAEYDERGFTFGAEAAKEHFLRVLSRFGPTLYGRKLPNSEGSAFDLWGFFYNASVLNARVSDVLEPDGFRHLDPRDDPGLVSKVRWNDVQRHLWEVNTAYRDFLESVRESEARISGLPTKAKTAKQRGIRKQRRR